MSNPQPRINASTITPGTVIAVERRGEQLISTRRRTDVLHATVTDKTVAPALPGERQVRYDIVTDLGTIERCAPIQTFPLISRPTVPAGAPDASALVVAGTVVAMVEHHDVTGAPATCTDPYGHTPGIPGCPVTVANCNGVPAELSGTVEEHPVRTGPDACGADQVGAEIAARVGIRHTVTDVRAGYSDPGRNRGAREVSTWSMTVDGHRVTVVRYEARDTLMSTVKPYASVLIDGDHVDRIPASKLEYGTARVVWDYLAELATTVPADPEVAPMPADDRVQPATATVDDWAELFGITPATVGQVDIVPASEPAESAPAPTVDQIETCGHRTDNPNKAGAVCTRPAGHLPANIHGDDNGRHWFPYGVHRDGTVDPGTRPEFAEAEIDAATGDQDAVPAPLPVLPWVVMALPHGGYPGPYIRRVGGPAGDWQIYGEHTDRGAATLEAVTLAESGKWARVRVDQGAADMDGGTVAEWDTGRGWQEWGALDDRGWIDRAVAQLPTGEPASFTGSQLGSVRVQLIDASGTVVRDFTRPTWARGIRASEREVYAIGASEGVPYTAEKGVRTGEAGTVTDTYRRVWTSSFGQLTAVVTRPAPAVVPTQGPATRPAVDQVDAPAVTVTIEVRPSGTPVVAPSADAPYASTWERYAPAINRPDVPAGMPYVIDAPEGWDGPVVQLEAKQVAAMLRGKGGFLAAWFPGGKFSVRTDGGSIDVRWSGGPSADLVDLVAKMWQGKDRDSQAECDRYRGTVLHVAPNGTETAYRLPGVYVFTRRERDTAPAAVEAARRFVPADPGREFVYGDVVDPYGRQFYGGSVEEAARWMAERGVTEWTRRYDDPRPVCPVERCADAAGHPYPGMHRTDMGRAFLATLPTGDGDQGGNGGGGTPTDVDPVGPAPADDQVEPAGDAPTFRTWEELAAWIGERWPMEAAPAVAFKPVLPPTETAMIFSLGIRHRFVPDPEGKSGDPLYCAAPCRHHITQPVHLVDTAPVAQNTDRAALADATTSFECPGHGTVTVPDLHDSERVARATQAHADCTSPADVRPLYTVTNNARGAIRVHAVGCRDIGRDSAGGGTHWDVRADDLADIVCDLYDDATRENWQDFAGDVDVMPCAGDVPDIATPTAPTVTASAKAEAVENVDRVGIVGKYPLTERGDIRHQLSNGWFIDSNERAHRRENRNEKYSATPSVAEEIRPAITVKPWVTAHVAAVPAGQLDESDDAPAAPAVAEEPPPAGGVDQGPGRAALALIDQAETAGAEMHADGMECAPMGSGAFLRITSSVPADQHGAHDLKTRLRDAFVRGYQTAADRVAEVPAVPVRPGQIATVRGWSGATIFVAGVTADQVIGIESGGTTARVGRHMVTAVKDLASTPTVAELADAYLSDRVSEDVRVGLEALAAGKSTDLGDSAALIEEGPEDAPYHVVHTKEGGTEVHGSTRGDGVWDVLKKWGRPRSFGGALYLRNTRNRLAVPSRIRSIGADIREATGCAVRIVVDNRAADVLAREADRKERVTARVEKLERRAERRTVEAHTLREAAEKLTEGIPMGEPVKMDHYSGPRHARVLERELETRRKSWKAGDKADYAAARAAGAAANEAAKEGPRAMMRRRERLETDARGIVRNHGGEPNPSTINGQRLAELRAEIAIITGRLEKLAANGEFVAWTRDDFRPGDEVNVGGHWRRVIRANAKTVTVPWWASTTPDTDTKGDTAPYDKIHGRRRDGWQIDTPAGEPWPVSDAKRVDKWLRLTIEAGRPYSEEDARTRRMWVRFAERIGYGLPRTATDSEVEAYRLKDMRLRTVGGRRAWYLELLGIFERLQAGENADTVAASVHVADVEPAWKLPEGTPVDVRVDQLRRGDIIAGYWDTSGLASRDLARHFSGPVAYVSKKENRRERGDWVTVRLVDGREKEFKSHIWFATYPQGRPTVRVADLVAGQRADVRGRDQFGNPSRCWGYVSAPSVFMEGPRNRADRSKGHPMLGVTVSETPSGLGGIVMQIYTERDAWCAVLDEREPAQLPAVALAEEAGEAAYRAGRSRAPGIDVTVRELIAGLPVGSGSGTIMEAFTRGYDRAADEAARLVLAGADQ